MSDFKEIYRYSDILPHTSMLIVHIPNLIETYFPEIKKNTYSFEKPTHFKDNLFLKRFFQTREIKKINELKSCKRQIEWISGRWAVKQLFVRSHDHSFQDFSISNGNPESVIEKILSVYILNLPGGAPFLADYPDHSISISHSGCYTAATYSITNKSGVDIEEMRDRLFHGFISIAFSKREMSYNQISSTRQIFLNWTKKEAFLKFIKKGFHEDLRNVEILNDAIYYKGIPVGGIGVWTDGVGDSHICSVIYEKSIEFPRKTAGF